ncbi:ALF repeat-containing protein [Trichodesmium erythraeum 21-75]|nr:ALF repeat-containing protein [Trichodesmium erythraeum 21-75]
MSNQSEKISQSVSGSSGVSQQTARGNNNSQLINQSVHLTEQQKTLAEAATEIQRLLKQLEVSDPNATEVEIVAYVNDETTPSLKRRAVAALKSGSEAAIEEFLDNPYINVGKAIVKSWIKPE